MKPEVQRIQALQDFVSSIAALFCEQLRIVHLSQPGTAGHSSASIAVIRLIDIASVVNYLKMFNSAIMNDFAMFKRFVEIKQIFWRSK